jgi:hypothetical protein
MYRSNRELAEASVKSGALLRRRDWFNTVMNVVMPIVLFGLFNAMCFEFIPRLNLMNLFVSSVSIAWVGYTIYCIYRENKLLKFDTCLPGIENERIVLAAFEDLKWPVHPKPRVKKYRKHIVTSRIANKTVTVLPMEDAIYLNIIHDLTNIRRSPLTFGGNAFVLNQIMEAIKKQLP